MANFSINGEAVEVDAGPRTPLLWVIREHLKYTGTKFGCGVGQCGACTVHIDGASTYSCLTPVSAIEGREITTIEGLSPDSDHPATNPDPTRDEIVTHMSTILCRCGTYSRIIRAIERAAEET